MSVFRISGFRPLAAMPLLCRLLLTVSLLVLPLAAWAQQADDEKSGQTGQVQEPTEDDIVVEVPDEEPEAPPPTDDALAPQTDDLAPTPGEAEQPQPTKAELAQAQKKIWKDIVVLPRKTFLRRKRVELMPFVGTTINDTLIQHTAIGANLNYFLTDVLAIGIEGMYYFDNVLNDEFLVRYHYQRVPSLNRYRYTATGNFSYAPIYGKFSILNKPIVHYDIWVSGGVGITGTEVIPRDFNNESFSNISLTFPVGIGTRLFVTKWLAVQVMVRNYMMLDTFEAPGRTIIDGDEAKDKESETKFINNLVLSAGVSVFFPFGFEYSTYR